MALEVTRRWSDDRFTRGVSGEITFDVTGATSRNEASGAVPFQAGSSHEEDSRLRALQPEATKRSADVAGIYVVVVRFSNPAIEGGGGDPGSDPTVDRRTRISWGRAGTSEPSDFDMRGEVITNGAGDFYEPKMDRVSRGRTFRIIVWEKFYDYAKAEHFEGTVNSNDWAVTNSDIVFFKGTVKCTSIMPAADYTPDQTPIPIAYDFELRPKSAHFPNDQPFQHHVVNQGRHGWYADTSDDNKPKRGPIHMEGGGAVTEDVPLSDNGTPLDLTLTVEGNAPVPAPGGMVPNPLAAFDSIVTGARTKMRIHLWMQCPVRDFKDMGL